MSASGAAASVAAAPCRARGIAIPRVPIGLLVNGDNDVSPEIYRLLWERLGELPDIEVETERARMLLRVFVMTVRDETGKPYALSLNTAVTYPEQGTLREYFGGQYCSVAAFTAAERVCGEAVAWFDRKFVQEYRELWRVRVN